MNFIEDLLLLVRVAMIVMLGKKVFNTIRFSPPSAETTKYCVRSYLPLHIRHSLASRLLNFCAAKALFVASRGQNDSLCNTMAAAATCAPFKSAE